MSGFSFSFLIESPNPYPTRMKNLRDFQMPLVPPGSKTEAKFLDFLGVEFGVMGALAISDASIAISTPFEESFLTGG